MTSVQNASENAVETATTFIAEKEWTVMVYMAGGNNLSEDMVTTLQSLISWQEYFSKFKNYWIDWKVKKI